MEATHKRKPISFKRMWVFYEKNVPKLHTIAFTRKECIEKFIKGTSMTWNEVKKYGWRPIKTTIYFDPERC